MSAEDIVKQLKLVKVPFWARWRGYFAARRRRKEAQKEVHYITTVYAWTRWTDIGVQSRQWYILKQDGTGKRFYEYGCDHRFLETKEKNHSEYARIVEPWVLGHWTNQQMKEYGPKTMAPQSAK